MLSESQTKITLFLYLIDISIVAVILYYLSQINDCSCFFNGSSSETAHWLYGIISVECCLLFFYVLQFYQTYKNKVLDIYFTQLMTITIILTVIYCLLYYIVTNIAKTVNESCICFHKQLKYLLYFQMIIFTVSFSFILHSVFIQWCKKNT